MQIKPDEITSILKSRIEGLEAGQADGETDRWSQGDLLRTHTHRAGHSARRHADRFRWQLATGDPGRPIREPVFQQGPFVMNTRQEIYETMLEYQRTQFGGWPWPSDEPEHSREEGRFARHPDGKIERPA